MSKKTKIAVGALTVSGMLISIWALVSGVKNLVDIISYDDENDIDLTVKDGDV